MAYGILDLVKDFTGEVGPANISDERFNQIIDLNDGLVEEYIFRKDVPDTDPDYRQIQLASSLYSAADILGMFSNTVDQAKLYKQKADQIVKAIVEHQTEDEPDTLDSALIHLVTPYKSYPLNPDAVPYSNVRSRIAGKNVMSDPTQEFS